MSRSSGSKSGKNNANNGSQKSSRNRRSGSKRRRRKPKVSAVEFWGRTELEPMPLPRIEVSTDPSSVVRSLGAPPLAGQERVAEATFEMVYNRAVGLAGALAAAGGLLVDPEDIADEPELDESDLNGNDPDLTGEADLELRRVADNAGAEARFDYDDGTEDQTDLDSTRGDDGADDDGADDDGADDDGADDEDAVGDEYDLDGVTAEDEPDEDESDED